jgi:hypothetical protein
MRKIKLFFLGILICSITSCSKTEEPIDESKYYSHNEPCDANTKKPNGVCGTLNGRILVIPGKSYNYNFSTWNSVIPFKIEWITLNGDVKIVSGQGFPNATFKFGRKFTTGKIAVKVELMVKKTGLYLGSLKLILPIAKID